MISLDEFAYFRLRSAKFFSEVSYFSLRNNENQGTLKYAFPHDSHQGWHRVLVHSITSLDARTILEGMICIGHGSRADQEKGTGMRSRMKLGYCVM
jgi:hypothetical protein